MLACVRGRTHKFRTSSMASPPVWSREPDSTNCRAAENSPFRPHSPATISMTSLERAHLIDDFCMSVLRECQPEDYGSPVAFKPPQDLLFQPEPPRKGRKRAVSFGVGAICPKCGDVMDRKEHPPAWVPKRDQPYYFEYWDICHHCSHFQLYETAKRFLPSLAMCD